MGYEVERTVGRDSIRSSCFSNRPDMQSANDRSTELCSPPIPSLCDYSCRGTRWDQAKTGNRVSGKYVLLARGAESSVRE